MDINIIKTFEIIQTRSNIHWNSHKCIAKVWRDVCPSCWANPRTFVGCICSETRLKSTTLMRIPLAVICPSTWVKTNIRQLSNLWTLNACHTTVQHCKAAVAFLWTSNGSCTQLHLECPNAASLIPTVWSDWIQIYATHSSRDMRVGFRSFSMYSP